MGGELLGMDGIGAGRYNGAATALEDSEVCVLPYALIEQMATEIPALRHQLHAIMAREIVRDHGVMMLLGSMRAEERLATFLLNLSKRFTARGFSPSEFHLRMTREELGSYLGLKLETVSRLFSRFHDDGLIEVQQKHVRILDIGGLTQILATRH
jgi:CRP/FNR family transcriptional regulator